MSGYAVHLADGSWLAVERYEQHPGDGALLAWTDHAPWPYRIPRSEWRGIAPASNLINAAASSGKRRTKRSKSGTSPGGKEFSVKAEDKVRPGREKLLTPMEVQEGARFAFTDDGNASRFAEDHESRLIYVHGPGWLRYTGKYWKEIPEDDVLKDARRTARRIRKEALAVESDAMAEAIVKWAKQSANRSKLEGMVKLAKGGDDRQHSDLRVDLDELDSNLDVLNTPSGIVDLRTGEVLPPEATEGDYCTRITHSSFDADASQAPWIKVLTRLLPDPELRAVLKRCAGASITGHVPKAFFALIGDGDNGKTLVVEVISGVLGSYAGAAAEGTFTNSSNKEAMHDLATLRGARFVAVTELRERHGLAYQRLNRATGQERLKARGLYGKYFEYMPQFSLWMPTNHRPNIPAREKATWNRNWPFGFDVAIPEDEQITDFAEQLVSQHGSGILAWLVEGAVEFYAAGKKLGAKPDAMKAKTAEWQDRDDLVGRWVKERTEAVPKRRAAVPSGEFWRDFQQCLKEDGEGETLKEYNAAMFHEEMDEYYPNTRTEKGLKGSTFGRKGVVVKTGPR